MTHPMLKKRRTHRYQVIKTFESEFKAFTVKSVKNKLTKNYVSVISLIMFYEIRKLMMYTVIGEVIYTIIGDYICLYYIGLIQ